MTTPPTDSQEHNLYLRIQNSAMTEAMHDTAHRLGFVYMGAQGFAGAVHHAVERTALLRVTEMADALRAAGVAESVIESALATVHRASFASVAVLDLPPLTRVMEVKVVVARGTMVVAAAEFGTYLFPAAPEDVAAWAPKIGQRAMIEWALVPAGEQHPGAGRAPRLRGRQRGRAAPRAQGRPVSADREPSGAELRDAMREKVAMLEAQVRVWRHLAETGSILSRDLAVVGVDEGARAMGALLQRSTQHANQGAAAMREKCALAMIAGASPEDIRALPMPTPEEIMRAVKGPQKEVVA